MRASLQNKAAKNLPAPAVSMESVALKTVIASLQNKAAKIRETASKMASAALKTVRASLQNKAVKNLPVPARGTESAALKTVSAFSQNKESLS